MLDNLGSGEIILLGVLFFPFLLTLTALTDLIRTRFEARDKSVWFLIVLFVPLFGSLLYFILGRRRRLIY